MVRSAVLLFDIELLDVRDLEQEQQEAAKKEAEAGWLGSLRKMLPF